MAQQLTCIIIDDDKLFQTIMEGLINKTSHLDLKGIFENALDASKFLQSTHVDIIFLDVEMPFMSGLEFIKTLNDQPQIILVTGNKEYALDAFEYNVTDYLLKPIDNYQRFVDAVNKAENNISNKENYTTKDEYIFVKVGTAKIKLNVAEINYIEAFGDYIKIYTADQVHVVYTTLKSFLSELNRDEFIQTHRSYIVRLDKVEAIEGNAVLIAGKKLALSRTFKKAISKRL